MPGASEFRDAAARFQAMAESLAREAGDRRSVTAVRFGLTGPAADEVDRRLDLAVGELLVASERYVDLARECARRAGVCDEYAAQLMRYWTMSPIERSLEPYPTRPAPWADA